MKETSFQSQIVSVTPDDTIPQLSFSLCYTNLNVMLYTSKSEKNLMKITKQTVKVINVRTLGVDLIWKNAYLFITFHKAHFSCSKERLDRVSPPMWNSGLRLLLLRSSSFIDRVSSWTNAFHRQLVTAPEFSSIFKMERDLVHLWFGHP